ncbi:IS481 family transposase [Acidisarcina polymorpha]|uniref:IS481 family transposase n=2 Tax=Acidisarcina polymorpha TaxID=2211140 RepID=UPI000DF0022C|nr:IS481 family transposase [Acidisarcina polymorpha]
MPWRESRIVDQRLQFLSSYQKAEMSVTDLCHEYGISRPTAYKWIKRYNEVGPEGLLDISRRPHGCSHATSMEIENEILALRKRFPSWGARKLKARLEKMNPNVVWPAASTIGQILRRAGLTNPVRKRRRTTPYSEPFAEVTAPNQLWCMDFKGWFRTGDGHRCDPFTITDAYSRYLIRCQAITRMDTAHVLAICEAAMREYGVPDRIRTDNGCPFSGHALLGLSQLSLNWVRLGIVHERIQPGKPQQNGRHERMHRTLKQDTTNPSAKTLQAQQKRFDEFRRVYNHERPHEALGNETPGNIYVPSSRLLPRYTKAYQYPAHFQTRRVNDSGDISWHKGRVFISQVFRGQDIALEKVQDAFYRVYFCSLEVGAFDVNEMRFLPALRP